MKYRTMVVKYGYAEIEAESERAALDKTKSMTDNDFDWSHFDEAQVVEEVGHISKVKETEGNFTPPDFIRDSWTKEKLNVLNEYLALHPNLHPGEVFYVVSENRKFEAYYQQQCSSLDHQIREAETIKKQEPSLSGSQGKALSYEENYIG